jgi:hypothetical protein
MIRPRSDEMKTAHSKSLRSSRRRATNRPDASSPPMRTIDLTGFYCRKGDRDYATAAEATGTTDGSDIYWFREVGDRMMWDDLSLVRQVEQNRSPILKIDGNQRKTAAKKTTAVERYVRFEEGFGVKKDAASKKDAVIKKNDVVKKVTAVKEDAAVKKESSVKDNTAVDENPFIKTPDTIKKEPFLGHTSEKVVDTKGKGKRARDEETSPEKLSESKPSSAFNKVKVDEIDDIGVAMQQEAPALAQALGSSSNTTPKDAREIGDLEGLLSPTKKGRKHIKCATQ